MNSDVESCVTHADVEVQTEPEFIEQHDSMIKEVSMLREENHKLHCELIELQGQALFGFSPEHLREHEYKFKFYTGKHFDHYFY